MKTLLNYPPENDTEFFGKTNYKLGTINVIISAGTFAGKRYIKDPQKPNEDAFSIKLLNGTIVAAVFDGTSSLKPIKSLKNETGARFASHFLKQAFENKTHGLSPKEIIRELNKLLLETVLKFDGTSLSDIHTLPTSTATIVQIDPVKHLINISHIGDSFCMHFSNNNQSHLVTIDKNKSYDDSILAYMKKIAEEKHITPREARQDERIKQKLLDTFQDSHNKADCTGQGVINGDPNAEQYIQDISLPLQDVDSLIIGSDGIIPPGFDEQNENDRKKMHDILKENSSVEDLIRRKIEIEDNDPGWQLLRYKHSDDGTGIFIKLLRK